MSRVTVICICYNHADYVIQAMQSVLDQDYADVELIIADDASSDDSANIIDAYCTLHPGIKFLANKENLGNCITFNKALALASGDFVIDLAADDMLEPTRVTKGIEAFEIYDASYAIHYSDAWLINEQQALIGLHSTSTKSIQKNPFLVGDVFEEVLKRYFICPPSVMAKREVLDALGGYDEHLSYEDFDYFVRSSRLFNYCVSPEPLVVKRILPHSKSSDQNFTKEYHQSTLAVCKKALGMVRNESEKEALAKRVMFECRDAIRGGQRDVAQSYLKLMNQLPVGSLKKLIYSLLLKFT